MPDFRCVQTKILNPCPHLGRLFNMLQQHWTHSSIHCLSMLGSPSIHFVYSFLDNTIDEVLPAYGVWWLQSILWKGRPWIAVQGVCQGNIAGPAIWLATSIVLMNMVQSNSHHVLFSSLISHWSIDLLGLLYMDDCNLFTMDDDGCHPCSMIANIQHNHINLWQGVLAVTGGSFSVKNHHGAFWWCAFRDIGGHFTLSIPFQPHLPSRIQCITLNPSDGSTPMKALQWLGWFRLYWGHKNLLWWLSKPKPMHGNKCYIEDLSCGLLLGWRCTGWFGLLSATHWPSLPSLNCKPILSPHGCTASSFLALAQTVITHLPYNMHWQSIMA